MQLRPLPPYTTTEARMGHDAIARSINIRTMIKVRRMVVNQDAIV